MTLTFETMSFEFEPKENHTCPLFSQILNEFSQRLLCHAFTLLFPVTLHPQALPRIFLDSENKRIRKCHSPRSSQQHTWLTLPLFQELAKNHSTASSCQAFSKHTSKMPSMMASLQGLLARPSTETSWTKLGEVRTQVRQRTGSQISGNVSSPAAILTIRRAWFAVVVILPSSLTLLWAIQSDTKL